VIFFSFSQNVFFFKSLIFSAFLSSYEMLRKVWEISKSSKYICGSCSYSNFHSHKLPLVFFKLDRNMANVSLYFLQQSVLRTKSGGKTALFPLTGCTYFDAGGLVVAFPFSSDCMWFSRASKRLLGALREKNKFLNYPLKFPAYFTSLTYMYLLRSFTLSGA